MGGRGRWWLASPLVAQPAKNGELALSLRVSAQAAGALDAAGCQFVAVSSLGSARLLAHQRMAAAAHACASRTGGMVDAKLAFALAGLKRPEHRRFFDDDDCVSLDGFCSWGGGGRCGRKF